MSCILFVLIVSFYTRCFMALIRGVKSDFPCPICLVPGDQMSDGSTHDLRTTRSMQKVYDEAMKLPTKTRQHEHLQKYGLRRVEVWKGFHLL